MEVKMSVEENKVIAQRLTEAINNQDLSAVDEILDADYFNHLFQMRGPQAFKQFLEMYYKAFPDLHATDEHIISEGDKVMVQGTATGTHKGEFRGISPTGKKTKYNYVNIYRIAGGKIVEEWDVYDVMNVYQELGVIEYKGFPGE